MKQQANQKRVNLSPLQKCQPGNYDDYQDRHLKLIAKAGPGGTASETYTNTDPCAFSYVNAKQVSQTPGWYEGVAFVDVFDAALRPHGNAKNVAMLYAAPGGLPVINLDEFDSDDDDNDDDADGVEMKKVDDNDLPVAKVKVTAVDLDSAMTAISTATSALDTIIQSNQPLPANSPYQLVPAARQYEAPSSAMDSPNPQMVTVMAAELRSPQVNGTPAGQAGLDCLTEAENVQAAARQIENAGGDLTKIATERAALKTAARRAVTALGDAEAAANYHKGTATEEANQAAAKAAKNITEQVRNTANATERYSRLVKRQELARKARNRNIAIITPTCWVTRGTSTPPH